MRVIGTIICLLFFHFSSLSQNKCVEVISDDNRPVQYVSVTIKKDKSFFVSDDKGLLCEKFISKIKTRDTVLFTAIGFQDRELIYSGNDTVILQRRFVSLPEVVFVNGEGADETWGTKKNPSLIGGYCTLGFPGLPILSLGRIMYPEGNYKKAAIRSVSFYDGKGHGMDVPVRLRIFLIGKDSLPVADYLNENMVINTKGRGWITFDLKEKGLIMPKEGLIFCVELFANSDDLYYLEKRKDKNGKVHEIKRYGFSIGMEEGGYLSVMKYNSWNPWRIVRFTNHPCGDIVCRVNLKVWR